MQIHCLPYGASKIPQATCRPLSPVTSQSAKRYCLVTCLRSPALKSHIKSPTRKPWARDSPFHHHAEDQVRCRAYLRTGGKAQVQNVTPEAPPQEQHSLQLAADQAEQIQEEVDSNSIFPQAHVSPSGLLEVITFAIYFPFGSLISFLRMGLWVGLLAVDQPWLTANDSGIRVLQMLLGLNIRWHHAELLPRERHVIVSNHVTAGDLMVLYSLPTSHTHLISVSLPPQACRARNHRIKLVHATPESYKELAKPSCTDDVHLFPEGGLTNGKGMMRFSRGFMRFAQSRPVVPVAMRASLPWGITTHTLTSSFLANLFWFCFTPSIRLEATILPALNQHQDEGNAAFVERVQQAIAAELNVPIVDFTVQQKRQRVQHIRQSGRAR